MEPPALCAALQASGLPSNIHRGVVEGKLTHIGINNGSLYGNQGKIFAMMNHGTSDNITGHHLRYSIEA